MDSGNRFGDIEISDPKAMRALAHPVRLAILERLQRHGPATASRLSPHVGATPSVTSWHLRHLAGFGLVRDAEGGTDRRERRWAAVARGFRVEVPADEEGWSAARLLAGEMFARNAELPLRWLTETAPDLEPEWARLAGASNTRIVVTAAELAALKDALEELIAPYVVREPDERPPGTRDVRLLTYALPQGPETDVTE
ncbi:helix-turn-helix domain-containing protein [Streptomyces sp. MBT65]|uniref:ArsR/SmtB family transcription factor n=1 Tax=Streptomyces sp. MBT65 TaxID=1488395 RepID=UPI00190D7EF9|nr:helix-turn-helix domain-containing protein [Streptomyces sp. MBT65]MBK3577691.1 helix-turn-helix domain-containing protein [Streptomyces sp. MBT65]